jgi:hypothetical protein
MKSVIRLSVLSLLTAFLAGCGDQFGAGDVSYSAIAGNLTPELKSLEQRPVDVDRHMAFKIDHEWRMFHDDLIRAFHADHPTRMAPYPIMYTSGQPR